MGITWKGTDGHVSAGDVSAVESHFGVRLPMDYVAVAMENNGGYPSLQAFDFPYKQEAVFSRLLSLHADKPDYIIAVYTKISDRVPSKLVPFADDPFGNYLCFDYRTCDVPTIVFWDHERAFQDPAGADFPICDTFTSLLDRLYD